MTYMKLATGGVKRHLTVADPATFSVSPEAVLLRKILLASLATRFEVLAFSRFWCHPTWHSPMLA